MLSQVSDSQNLHPHIASKNFYFFPLRFKLLILFEQSTQVIQLANFDNLSHSYSIILARRVSNDSEETEQPIRKHLQISDVTTYQYFICHHDDIPI